MRYKLTACVMAAAAASMFAGGAAAQFGGLGSAIKREANKKRNEAANKVEEAIRGGPKKRPGNSLANSGGSAKLGTPSQSLTDFTKCAGIPLEKVTVGRLGDYTFQQGFSKEKRTGFINRRAGNVIRDCITPSLQAGEIVYFEVDTPKYKQLRKGNGLKWQCVKSNNPSAGTVKLNDWNGTSDRYLGTSAMKLHCGNDQGVSDCATGTNSDRAGAYTKEMKSRGKTGISFLARYLERGNESRGGKLYCQFYAPDTGKSLVGFEMMFQSR
ncbi:MAG: hypothetical protein ABJZ03_12990 [Marinomonas sp.]